MQKIHALFQLVLCLYVQQHFFRVRWPFIALGSWFPYFCHARLRFVYKAMRVTDFSYVRRSTGTHLVDTASEWSALALWGRVERAADPASR